LSQNDTPEKEPSLIKDIRTKSTKSSASIGVVELTLEEGTQIKVVGAVYGLEHQFQGEGFKATVFLDQYNQRLKVVSYEGENKFELMERLKWLASANGFDKTIVMTYRDDWQRFLRRGYVLEAVLKYFHHGEDAYVMSKFGSQERMVSHSLFEEIQLIETVMERDPLEAIPVQPTEFEFRLAERTDVPALIALYQSIFETYPSPLIHSDYLESVFQRENLFAVATKDGEIVSAASAELNPSQKAAELTDCATIKSMRGRGLMAHLLLLLEGELSRRDYVCAYTMSRARSFGINNVFYQLKYEFQGRLVNNCDIYGSYEDMNIWVKNLVRETWHDT